MAAKRNKHGFTFVEIFMSIAIVSLVAVMVCALFSSMFKASKKGLDVSVGSSVAGAVLDELVEQNSSELRKRFVEKTSGGFSVSGIKSMGERPYYYILEILPLSGNYANSNLLQSDIVVFWDTDSSELVNSNRESLSKSSITDFLQTMKSSKSADVSGLKYVRFTRFIMLSE